jgi:hypothetical protein
MAGQTALQVIDANGNPIAGLDWTMTRNNLGNALQTLGERESGTARLEEAVAGLPGGAGGMDARSCSTLALYRVAKSCFVRCRIGTAPQSMRSVHILRILHKT